MAIYLKDPELDALARKLARLEGASLTEAVKRALRERHERLEGERDLKRRRAEARLRRIRALPVRDASDPDQALYDEHGLPKA